MTPREDRGGKESETCLGEKEGKERERIQKGKRSIVIDLDGVRLGERVPLKEKQGIASQGNDHPRRRGLMAKDEWRRMKRGEGGLYRGKTIFPHGRKGGEKRGNGQH